MNKTEEEIIAGIKSKDDRIVELVYVNYRRSFFKMLRSYNIDVENMKDIYQESMLALCQNIIRGKYNPELSSLHSYILGIGKYKALEFIRKYKKEQQVIDEWKPNEEFEVETELSTQQLKLKEKFMILGPKCREIIRLFYFRGLNIKEIVDLKGYKSENVVKSQKSRCLKQLKSLVKS